MTILAALLPGARQLRTPLACGFLITALIGLSVDPSSGAIATDQRAQELWDDLQRLSLIQLSCLIFIAYLIGIVWEQLVSGGLVLARRFGDFIDSRRYEK